MRVPRVRDTGRFDRDLGYHVSGGLGAFDPINVTVWSVIAAAIPAQWLGVIWGVIALMNVGAVS